MATKKSRAAMPATDKKMSVIDAAAKLLADAGEPLNCKTMIEQIAANGYWTTPVQEDGSGELRDQWVGVDATVGHTAPDVSQVGVFCR
jgi:hypothetical protein